MLLYCTYQKTLPELVFFILSLGNTFTFQSESFSYCFVWLLFLQTFKQTLCA